LFSYPIVFTKLLSIVGVECNLSHIDFRGK
jgi:hypothetical protein